MAESVIHLPTRQELKKIRGNIGAAYPFLEMMTLDTVYYFDDFFGDVMRGGTAPGTYEEKTTTDGGLDLLADQVNGVAKLGAGAGYASADNEYCGVSLPELHWEGDLNACMAVRIQFSHVTTCKAEIMFTDDVTNDAGAVSTLATFATTADDCAGWILDTDDTAYFQFVGAKATAEATKVEPSISVSADTWYTFVVCLQTDAAKGFILDANGYSIYESAWQADFIEGGTQVSPWIFIQARNAAGLTGHYAYLDYLAVWQRRTAS